MEEQPITRKWEGKIALTTQGKGSFKLNYQIEYGPTTDHGRILEVREAEAIGQQFRNELYRLTRLTMDPSDPCSSCQIDEAIRAVCDTDKAQVELTDKLCAGCENGSKYRPREGYE